MIESIIVVRPGAATGTDRLGNPVPGPAVRTTVRGCRIAPVSSGEPVEVDRGAVRTLLDVYAPASAAIAAGDTVEARGSTWLVDGAPAGWGSSGQVVRLKQVTG
ncbi:MAG: hypothetical protein AB7I24_08225 [Candidatus Nanopelagicales bacterium]